MSAPTRDCWRIAGTYVATGLLTSVLVALIVRPWNAGSGFPYCICSTAHPDLLDPRGPGNCGNLAALVAHRQRPPTRDEGSHLAVAS